MICMRKAKERPAGWEETLQANPWIDVSDLLLFTHPLVNLHVGLVLRSLRPLGGRIFDDSGLDTILQEPHVQGSVRVGGVPLFRHRSVMPHPLRRRTSRVRATVT